MFGAIFTTALIVSVIDRLTGPVRGMAGTMASFQKGIQSASAKLKDWGAKISGWSRSVSMAAAGGAAALWGILRPTAAVDAATRQLATVVSPMYGSMEEDLARVTKAAKDWSNEHVGSAEQFIRTSYNMVSAGLSTAQAIEGTRQATALATATNGGAASAAEYLATVYKNMGNQAADVSAEMQRLADITARTQLFFQFRDLGQLTEGMKYAVPVAKMYGISLEQVSSAIGTLNDSGITGGQAGTSFAAMMRQLNKASGDLGFVIARTADGGVDLVGTMETLRAQFGQRLLDPQVQQQLQQAFGDEGLRGLMALIDKTERLRQGVTELGAAAGTVARAQKEVEGGLGARWAKMKQRFQNMAITLGNKLIPLIEKLAPKFEKAVDAIAQFIDKNPGLAETVMQVLAIGTAVGAVAGPLLMLVGGALKVVGAFLGFRRVGLLLGAVRALAGKGVPAALSTMETAGTASVGRLAGKFKSLLGWGMKILLLWQEFKAIGSWGRDAWGKVEASANESQARARVQKAQQILSDPNSTYKERLLAQDLMQQAGWHAARARDIRRDVQAGGYLAGEQFLPSVLTGAEPTPADAPRQLTLLSPGGGGPQYQDFSLPAPGQAAPGGTAPDGGGPLRVEDPGQEARMDAILEELRAQGRKDPRIFVQMPDGAYQEVDVRGAAREAGA